MKQHRIKADLAGVIRKARHQKFPLHAALLELIDNSLDANASIVTITELNGNLCITDDGDGFRDIVAGLVVGKSDKTSGIGRYGVGLKDACIRYSNTTTIKSRGCQVSAPWEEIADETSDGEVFPILIEDDGKTHVILEKFRSRYPRAINTDLIRRVYAPLISANKIRLSLNGESLASLEYPKYTDALDVIFPFRGRTVRLHGGIYSPSDPMRRHWYGYNPFYEGRLIGDGKITTAGIGEEACTNFSFQIELIDDESQWVLATNKDDVEELTDLLETCYWEYTRPLLEKANDQTHEIELKCIEQAVNDKLCGRGNQTRKNRAGKIGTIKPTGTGKPKQRTCTALEDGEYIDSTGGDAKARPKIKFKFESLQNTSLGEVFRVGKGVLVKANIDNPFVARTRSNEDAMFGIAKLIYSIRSELDRNDIVADEIIDRIMSTAGQEMN